MIADGPIRQGLSPLLVVVVKAKSATQSLFFSGRRRRKTAGTLTLLYRVYNDDYLKKNKEKRSLEFTGVAQRENISFHANRTRLAVFALSHLLYTNAPQAFFPFFFCS